MKICDIVQFYSPLSGGVKRYIHDKMRYVESRPRTEHVVIVPSGRHETRTSGRTRIYGIRSARLPGSRSYRVLSSEKAIRRILAREDPDLLEVGDPYMAAWFATRIARDRGIPVVAYYHSDLPRLVGRPRRIQPGASRGGAVSRMADAYLRRLYGRMDATIVATERLRRLLERTGIPRLFVVPLGVNGELFRMRDSRGAIRARLGMERDGPLLLFVGRLSREKNLPELIRMMDRLDGRHRLLIVGDGEKRRFVRRMARRRDDVVWWPYTSDPERLSEIYSAADLLVHPGDRETFGLVSLEAQCCGTRVIAVRGGGVDPTLEGEEPMILADSPACDDLAAAVRRAIELRESPGAATARRERILRKFSWEGTFRKLFDVYDSVLAAGGRGGIADSAEKTRHDGVSRSEICAS